MSETERAEKSIPVRGGGRKGCLLSRTWRSEPKSGPRLCLHGGWGATLVTEDGLHSEEVIKLVNMFLVLDKGLTNMEREKIRMNL